MLISRAPVDTDRAKIAKHGVSEVLLQQDREVAEAYQVFGTPSAVLVRPEGTVGRPLAEGADAIRALLTHAVEPPAPAHANGPCPGCGQYHDMGTVAAPMTPQSPKVGIPAPALQLPDLIGKTIDLADFQG